MIDSREQGILHAVFLEPYLNYVVVCPIQALFYMLRPISEATVLVATSADMQSRECVAQQKEVRLVLRAVPTRALEFDYSGQSSWKKTSSPQRVQLFESSKKQ